MPKAFFEYCSRQQGASYPIRKDQRKVMLKTIVFDFGNVIGFFDYGLTTERLARHSPLPAEEIRRVIYCGDLEDAYESGRITSAEFLRRVRDGCGLTCPDEVL